LTETLEWAVGARGVILESATLIFGFTVCNAELLVDLDLFFAMGISLVLRSGHRKVNTLP
jgi:hypothetical protein